MFTASSVTDRKKTTSGFIHILLFIHGHCFPNNITLRGFITVIVVANVVILKNLPITGYRNSAKTNEISPPNNLYIATTKPLLYDTLQNKNTTIISNKSNILNHPPYISNLTTLSFVTAIISSSVTIT